LCNTVALMHNTEEEKEYLKGVEATLTSIDHAVLSPKRLARFYAARASYLTVKHNIENQSAVNYLQLDAIRKDAYKAYCCATHPEANLLQHIINYFDPTVLKTLLAGATEIINDVALCTKPEHLYLVTFALYMHFARNPEKILSEEDKLWFDQAVDFALGNNPLGMITPLAQVLGAMRELRSKKDTVLLYEYLKKAMQKNNISNNECGDSADTSDPLAHEEALTMLESTAKEGYIKAQSLLLSLNKERLEILFDDSEGSLLKKPLQSVSLEQVQEHIQFIKKYDYHLLKSKALNKKDENGGCIAHIMKRWLDAILMRVSKDDTTFDDLRKDRDALQTIVAQDRVNILKAFAFNS
jgi:hypothetical protein